MTTPYYQDAEVKRKIDEVLQANARLRTNLGVNSTPDEVRRAKAMEVKSLKRVHYLDPEKIDRLLIDD